MKPQATLLIPIYQQVDSYLEQCVRSALSQSVVCEVLAITAANTPESNRQTLFGIQQDFPRLRVIEQSRPGFPAALNQGIALASAERFGFLLSDDWLEPTTVEDCLAEHADVISTQMTTYAADGKTEVPRPWKMITMDLYNQQPDLEQKANYLQHFFLLNRQRVLDIGGLEERFGDAPGIDDFELIWRLIEHGASVAIVEKPLYNYRDHAGERLTLCDPAQLRATMSRILEAHGWRGRQLEEALVRHARWFGKTKQQTIAELTSSGEPLPSREQLQN